VILTSRTNSWIDGGSGKWETGANWSSGFSPSTNDAVEMITNAGNKTVTIDFTTVLSNAVYPSMIISNLYIAGTANSTNTLFLNNAYMVMWLQILNSAMTLETNGAVVVNYSWIHLPGTAVSVIGNTGGGASLTITNGGAVCDYEGFIGSNSTSSANSVLVAGTGSVWSNQYYLDVGCSGWGNSLVISNGGAVCDLDGTLGYQAGSSNNTVVVTGTGSVWYNQTYLDVGGSGSSNLLTIAGGSVAATNVAVGYGNSASNNVLIVSGGNLFVTNALGIAPLIVSQAGGEDSLLLSGGAITANQLVLTNGANSVFTFNAGTLTSGGTFVTNNQVFVVGDGTDAATFQINGGVHSFVNNLEIRNNATLTGCGTINGNVVVDPGGTVLADCGGTLTLTGIVTNNGTMRANGASVLESYGTVVNNGTVDAINGGTSFHGAFLNYGTVLTASSVQISQVGPSGQTFVVKVPSVTGHTYQLQYTTSLTPANWTPTGASQSGNGGVLIFTDPSGLANAQRFYRVEVTAP
jgi:T5SS/PEP-CTERM-associated repeat protein